MEPTRTGYGIAESYGRVAEQPESDFSITRTIGQIGSGFFEGFTTIDVGADPTNSAEMVANSIGHLLGFVGYIPGAGAAAKLGAMGTVRAFGLIKAGSKAQKVATTALKGIGAAGQMARGKSIPLRVANTVMKRAGITAGLRSGIKVAKLADVAEGAAHLGIASATSSWQGGFEEMIDSAMHGAIFGGAFRGLGNVIAKNGIIDVNKLAADAYGQEFAETISRLKLGPVEIEDFSNKFTRGLAGALFQGGMATARDLPMPLQVYEYLMGAYFGAHEMPMAMRRAKEDMMQIYVDSEGKRRPSPEIFRRIMEFPESETFRKAEPDVQEQMRVDIELYAGRVQENYTTAFGMLAAGVDDVVQARGLADVTRDALRKGDMRGIEGFIDSSYWLAEYNKILEAGGHPNEALEAAAKIARTRREERESRAKDGDPVKVGDFAQWTSGGTDRFPNGPRPVKSIQVSGTGEVYAFFEGTSTGIPLSELRRMEAPVDPEQAIRSTMESLERMPSEAMESILDADALGPLTNSVGDFARDILTRNNLGGNEEAIREVTDVVQKAIVRHRGEVDGWERMLAEVHDSLWEKRKGVVVRRLREGDQANLFAPDGEVRAGIRVSPESEGIFPTADDPAYQKLRQVWKRQAEASTPITKAAYDPVSGRFTAVGERDGRGNMVVERIRPDLLATTLEPYGIGMVMVESEVGRDGLPILEGEVSPGEYVVNSALSGMPLVAGIKAKGKMRHTDGFLFDEGGPGVYMVNRETGASERQTLSDITPENVSAMLRAKLETMAFAAGRNGELAGRIYEEEMSRSIERVMSEASAVVDETGVEQSRFSRAQVEEALNVTMLNNIAMLEAVQGLSMERMLQANVRGEGDFILNIQALNKRMQLFSDGAPAMDPAMYRSVPGMEEGLRYAILNTVKKGEGAQVAEGLEQMVMDRMSRDQKDTVESYIAEHHLDGVFFLRQDAFDALRLDGGLEKEIGAIKGAMAYSGEAEAGQPLGAMLGKFAVFRAPDAMTKAAESHGLHGLMYTSAAKQRGLRKTHDYTVSKDGTLAFDGASPRIYTMPFDGFRLNMGASEKAAHNLADQPAPVQLAANIENYYAADHFFRTHTLPRIKGDEAVNRRVRDYLQTGKGEVADLDVDAMGVNEIMQVLTQPGKEVISDSELYQKVWRRILRLHQEEPVSDPDLSGEEDLLDMVRAATDVRSPAQANIELMARSGNLIPAAIDHKSFWPYIDTALRNYVKRRLTRPKIKYSGSAIFAPMDPWFQHEMVKLTRGKELKASDGTVLIDRNGYVQEGALILDASWRGKTVRWLDGETTLGEAYDAYRAAKAKGASKKHLAQMEELLTFQTIRVPADSPSGTRSLRLAGFSERQGTGVHLNNSDMIFLGGADLDIDKGFLFQDLDRGGAFRGSFGGKETPKTVKRPIAKYLESEDVRYQWYDEQWLRRGRKVVIDTKGAAEEAFGAQSGHEPLDGTPGGRALQRTLEMLNGTRAYDAARAARIGNMAVGPFAKGGRTAHALMTIFPELRPRKAEYDKLRAGGLQLATDAADYANLELTPQLAAERLRETLMGTPETNERWEQHKQVFDAIRDIDNALDGYRTAENPRTGRTEREKMSTFEALDLLRESRQKLDGIYRRGSDKPAPVWNPWYRAGMEALEGLAYRKLGARSASDSDERSSFTNVKPSVGRFFDAMKVRINEVLAAAKEGDEVAQFALDAMARKSETFYGDVAHGKVEADGSVRVVAGMRNTKTGYRYVPERVPIARESWQVDNDMWDGASLLVLYDAARKAADSPARLGKEEMMKLAEDAKGFRDRWAKLFRGTDLGRGSDTHSRIAGELGEYKDALLRERGQEVFDYFERYLTASLTPQPMEIGEFLSMARSAAVSNEGFRGQAREQIARDRGVEVSEVTPDEISALVGKWYDTGYVADATRPGARNIRAEMANDYFASNISALGLDPTVVSERGRLAFFNALRELTDATKTGFLAKAEGKLRERLASPFVDPALEKVVGPQAARFTAAENEQYASFFWNKAADAATKFRQEDLNPEVVGEKVAERNRQDYEKLKRVLDRHPDIVAYFPQVFEGVTARGDSATVRAFGTSPEVALRADVGHFLDFFRAVEQGRVSEAMGKGRFPLMWHWIMPETWGKDAREVDLHVGRQPVMRPVRTAEGVVEKPVRDVFSIFDKIHEVANIAARTEQQVADRLRAKHEAMLSPFRGALGKDFAFLHDMAVATMEYRMGEVTRQQHRRKVEVLIRQGEITREDGEQSIREYEDRPQAFETEYKKRYGRYKKDFLDSVKRYEVTIGGQTRMLGPKDIVGTTDRPGALGAAYEALNESVYREEVYSPRRDSRFLRDMSGNRYLPNESASEPGHIRPLDPFASQVEISKYIQATGELPDLSMEAWQRLAHATWLYGRVETKIKREAVLDVDADGLPVGTRTPERELVGTLSALSEAGEITRAEVREHLARLQRTIPAEQMHNGQMQPGIIGRVEPGAYWPHNNYEPQEYRRYLKSVQEGMADVPAALRSKMLSHLKSAYQNGTIPQGDLDVQLREKFLRDTDEFSEVNTRRAPGAMRARGTATIPAWDHTPNAYGHYLLGVARGKSAIAKAAIGDHLIGEMKKLRPFGDLTGQFAQFAQMHLETALGGPTRFNPAWIDDPKFQLRKSPTYWLSDERVVKTMARIDNAFFKGRLLKGELDLIDPNTVEGRRLMMRAHWLSNLEGKYQLATLLTSTRSIVNNFVGGSSATIASTGLRHWLKAGNIGHLSKINPEIKTWEDADRFVAEKIGAIESYLLDDAHIPAQFREGRAREFWNEATNLIKGDHTMSDKKLMDVAKKYGIGRAVVDTSAWMLRATERRLRRRAALAHYLNAREVFSATGAAVEADHPWILSIARRGVENTQFLYDAQNKPMFGRSALGKVVSRFQTWALRSVDFRMRVQREAQAAGFAPGSVESERFQRLATMDLFGFALAAALPYTMFSSILPSPWNWLQDTSNILYQDDDEAKGMMVSALNRGVEALPPGFERPAALFAQLVSGDIERFAEHYMWNYIPFGITARNAASSLDNPARVVDLMTGIPLQRLLDQ